MKRKHSEMIKALNDNKGLLVLFRASAGWVSTESPGWGEKFKYFLCHPKHRKAVLALLNGGKAEVLIKNKSKPEPYWSNCGLPTSGEWENDWWYMNNDVESRVRLEKQMRYAYMGPSGFLTHSYDDVDELDNDYPEVASCDEFKLITFEVEL